MSKSPEVCVIIPFFQEKAGILRSTVCSIIDCTRHCDYEVLVVDDGSPVRARSELVDLAEGGAPVRIVEQPNAGPSSARNAGLEAVREDTPYIALLDSDDRWVADFIADGCAALDQGHDLFIGNTVRSGVPGTRFDWQADEGLNLDAGQHECIDAERKLYRFVGDFFEFLVYRSNICSSSAMMFRKAALGSLRFNERMFSGEDRLFKLHLGYGVRSVAFSERVYVEEGRGVNIFGSAGWGTRKSLRVLSSYLDLCRTILREVPLTAPQRGHVHGQLAATRYNLALSLAHLLVRGERPDLAALMRAARRDPPALALLVPNLIRALSGKVLHRPR